MDTDVARVSSSSRLLPEWQSTRIPNQPAENRNKYEEELVNLGEPPFHEPGPLGLSEPLFCGRVGWVVERAKILCGCTNIALVWFDAHGSITLPLLQLLALIVQASQMIVLL